jgi:AcrR family transcriptional regulator
MGAPATLGRPLADRLQAELRLSPGALASVDAREQVVQRALGCFLSCERVDMQSLAAELGVGRATLYRWFGDREKLLGIVLWRLSHQTLEWLAAQDDPEDTAHVLASIAAFMQVTSEFAPLRHFLTAEPAMALRVLLERDGTLINELAAWAEHRLAIAGFGTTPGDPSSAELAEVLVSVTSTYCWARIIAGGEADIDGAMHAARILLRAGQH